MAEENNLCFSDRKIHLILFRAKKYMDDKEEMFAYLDRQMGEDRFHCNLIKIIYVLGIPLKISQSDDTYATAKECADMVTKNYKLASKYVAWGINAWCDALGMPVYLPVSKDGNAIQHEIQKNESENELDWEGDIDKETHISSELDDAENLKSLFISLYVGYVRSALDRGLYYRYVDETEDISCIKGKFDIKDYYINKIPNGQAEKFKCTYSNFEFDNEINRIIKCTCKLLFNDASRRNQKLIRNILVRLNEVSDVNCNPRSPQITSEYIAVCGEICKDKCKKGRDSEIYCC